MQAVLEVLLCSSLPTQILIAWILGALGVPARTTDEQLSLTFVLVLSLADSALLILLMVVLARAHGDSPWLLWRGQRPVIGESVLGLLLVPVAVCMVAYPDRIDPPVRALVAQRPRESSRNARHRRPGSGRHVRCRRHRRRRDTRGIAARFPAATFRAPSGWCNGRRDRAQHGVRPRTRHCRGGTPRSRPERWVRSGLSSTCVGAAASRRSSATRDSTR